MQTPWISGRFTIKMRACASPASISTPLKHWAHRMLFFACSRTVEREVGVRPTSTDLRTDKYRRYTESVTVCVATDGNQGRGLAYGPQIFGCRCIVYIHNHVSPECKRQIESLGAIVIRVSGEYEMSVQRAREDARCNGWYSVSSTWWDDFGFGDRGWL